MRLDPRAAVEEVALLRMAAALRHRGPDGFGLLLDEGAGLVSTRLAIFDLPAGWQPLEASSGADALVYNGEVYNHPELRAELRAEGAEFSTTSDTEVVMRLLERQGLAALDRLNGQFSLAWWQPAERRLTLVRDRFGVRPLHFSLLGDGSLVFGSEAKALFASGEVTPEADPFGIDDVFTLWGPRPPRTAFRGVEQVPPGGIIVWERGSIVARRRWWTASSAAGQPAAAPGELEPLLRDSVRLRLRADVPVGAYLSGGLDSSLITALAQQETEGQLRTFSVAFRDPDFDERGHQEEVAKAIGTTHHVIEVGGREIAGAFTDVVWHAEAPIVRAAPVPLYLLAQEVREQGITVVATGEGADELFWGYDLFKEVEARALAQHDPAGATAMLDQLYAYLGASAERRGPAFSRFILETGAADPLLGSHATRAAATGAVRALYRPEIAEQVEGASLARLRSSLPDDFERLSALERAGWLEITTLLEPYLLAAQGDRVAMAHGVEGRYPFLDHRVFALSQALPPQAKLDGMRDKVVLRELADRVLPKAIAGRPKQPYRSPDVVPFFGPEAPAWVERALSASALDAASLFEPRKVAGLVRRCRSGRATGVRESMALVGVLSAQLWHRAFIDRPSGSYAAETVEPRVRIDRRSQVQPKEAV